MQRRHFYFVEPSKVLSQHITLLEGYLKAIISSDDLSQSLELLFCASRSTFNSLSPATRQHVHHEAITVMNPEKRRLALKTLVEFFVVLRYILRMQRGDVMFVSCVLPTTLLMLECVNFFLRRRSVCIALHGEIEGLFDESLQRFRSYGFWIMMWMRCRRSDSGLALVVTDDFIKRKLLAEYPKKLSEENLFVVHNPISTAVLAASPDTATHSACFIGHRTKFKGFEKFRQLSEFVPSVSFLAVGGGKIEDIRLGHSSELKSNEEYFQTISSCSVAVFPYIGGYTCSLSAAVLDALSVGLHVMASDRPCFTALADKFGPDSVTICHFPEEACVLLSDALWLAARRNGRARRLERLARSEHGLEAVRSSFAKMVLR